MSYSPLPNPWKNIPYVGPLIDAIQDYLRDHGGGGGGGSDTSAVNQVAHGFVVGDVLRYTGSAFDKAQADTSDHAEVIGIVDTVTNADNFMLRASGHMTGLSGLTPGDTYFLDPSTAGAMTNTAPSTAGQINKPLLVADSAVSGVFYNMRGEVVVGVAPITTISAMSGGPPSSPSNGDLWFATAVATNVTWQFIWDASGSKWDFVGGPPMRSWDNSGSFRQNTADNTWEIISGMPAITLARAGQYRFSWGAHFYGNNGVDQYLLPGTTAGSGLIGPYARANAGNSFGGNLMFPFGATADDAGSGVTRSAGATINLQMNSTSHASTEVFYAWLEATPIYIV